MNEVVPLWEMEMLHLAPIEQFDPRAFFTAAGTVRIKAVSGEFAERFVERSAPKRAKYTVLRVRQLSEPFQQARIYQILRSHAGDVGVVDLWRALCKQPDGEEGALDVTGKPNVFLMLDAEGKLCAVNAVYDDGWHIYTWPSPETVWPKGSRFLSH